MIGCAAASVEAWPFTAWRLFSTVRTPEKHGWAATLATTSGPDRPFPIGSVGAGSRGFAFIMRGFAHRTPSERNAICRAWIREGATYLGHGAVTVRIYALTRELRERDAPPSRALRWTCTDGRAVAAS